MLRRPLRSRYRWGAKEKQGASSDVETYLPDTLQRTQLTAQARRGQLQTETLEKFNDTYLALVKNDGGVRSTPPGSTRGFTQSVCHYYIDPIEMLPQQYFGRC